MPSKASDKRDRIIKAAIEVFAKNGFYNSKISEIAKKAGIADGTIYLYFKNKDDILISLFEEEMKKIIGRVRKEIDRASDPLEKLRIFTRAHLDILEENRSLAAVIQIELRQSNKFMKDYVPVKFAEFLKILSGIVREGKDRGVFRKDAQPGIAKRAIFGALDEMVLYWVLTPKPKYEPAQIAEALAGMFVGGLLIR